MKLRLLAPALGLFLLALLGACAGEDEGDTSRPCVVKGRLLNAETGEVLSRSHIYMHFNCDELGYKESPTPHDVTTFQVKMPGSTVRIRAYDTEQVYAPFEQTFEAKDGVLAVGIPLQPTHYILLRGRFEDGETGRSALDMKQSGEWMGLRLSIHDGPDAVHRDHIIPDLAGYFAIRVPRKRLRLQTVGTSTRPEQTTLDLSGVESDAYDLVIRMVDPKDD